MIENEEQLLTIIIPFLNEKEEVGNTLESLFKHTDNKKIKVLLINDASNDGYDYRSLTQLYDVDYIENKSRLGVAKCRDYGAKICKTKYLLSLDAHMRFRDNKWLDKLLNILYHNPKAIICCQTEVLKKNDLSEVYYCDEGISYGAYVNINPHHYFEPIWAFQPMLYPPLGAEGTINLEPISCLLGAAYAYSKEVWDYLGGFVGIKEYGVEEAYISIKAWLSDIPCFIATDVVIGHIYRLTPPYDISPVSQMYNRVLLSLLLLPSNEFKKNIAAATSFSKNDFYNTIVTLYSELDVISHTRDRIKGIVNHPYEYFLKLNQNTTNEMRVVEKQKLQAHLNKISAEIIAAYHTCNDTSLLSGKLGVCIFLIKLSESIDNHLLYELSFIYLKETLRNILKENSSETILDAGWALIFLFIETKIELKLDDFITMIDSVLVDIIFCERTKCNLMNKACRYVNARVYLSEINSEFSHIPSNILDKIAEISDLSTSLFNSEIDYNIFFEFALYYKYNFSLNTPSLYDIAHFYTPYDFDKKTYVIGLNGLAGIGIDILSKLK